MTLRRYRLELSEPDVVFLLGVLTNYRKRWLDVLELETPVNVEPMRLHAAAVSEELRAVLTGKSTKQ